MNKPKIFAIICLSSLFAFQGCKKEEDAGNPVPSKEQCIVTELTTPESFLKAPKTHKYEYNTKGKLARLVSEEIIRTFEYDSGGKVVKRTDSENGSVVYSSVYTYDAQGKWIIEAVTGRDGAYTKNATYNSQNQVTRIDYKNKDSSLDHFGTYKYANGNIISSSRGFGLNDIFVTFSYEYSLDKPNTVADNLFSHFVGAPTGFPGDPAPNKNLLKKIIQSDGEEISLDYEFNEEGLATKIIYTSSTNNSFNNRTHTYKYNCQ